MDNSPDFEGNAVTCIDISPEGEHLISGYKKGQLILWDLEKYKAVKVTSDIHKGCVISVKFLAGNSPTFVNVISSDFEGTVCLSEFSRGMFSMGVQRILLLKNKEFPFPSLAPLIPNVLYPIPLAEQSQIAAFGS
jgi:WD40 repeat protein